MCPWRPTTSKVWKEPLTSSQKPSKYDKAEAIRLYGITKIMSTIETTVRVEMILSFLLENFPLTANATRKAFICSQVLLMSN